MLPDSDRTVSPNPHPVDVEDLPADWTRLAPPPEVRTQAAVAWTGERLLVWSGYVFGAYCGGLAVYDPARDRWQKVTPPESAGSADLHPVAAGDVALLLGRDLDTGQDRMFAYRPPNR